MMETYFSGEKYFTLLFVLLSLAIQNYIFNHYVLYFHGRIFQEMIKILWDNFILKFCQGFFRILFNQYFFKFNFALFIFINFMIFFLIIGS